MVEEGFVAFFVAAIIFISITSILTGYYVRRARQRTRDLQEVAKAMTDHYTALESVLDSNEVSEKLKSALFSVNRVVCDREGATLLLSAIMSGVRSENNDIELDAELDGIRHNGNEITDSVHVVLQSAIFMALLRWPDTAKKARQIALDVAMNSQREREAVHALLQVRKQKSDRDDDNMLNGSSLIPA